MRTTLTIEDDLAAAIQHRRRELNHTLKQEVNDLLRAGLMRADEDHPKSDSGPFRVQPLDVGELLIPIDDVEAALDIAEGPWRS
jgi:hypothetical protein